LFQATLIICALLSVGVAVFDTPVTIDDNFVFSCLDSIPQPSEPLQLSGHWNVEYFGSSLPVYIAVPDRSPLILFTVNSSDEIQGYLLSCTDNGTVTDSMLVYYWNSEGFESQIATVNTSGRIAVTTYRDYGTDETNLFNFNEDGSFTPVNSSEPPANGSLEN